MQGSAVYNKIKEDPTFNKENIIMKTCFGYRTCGSTMKLLLLIMVFVGGISVISQGYQNIDPFYLRLLHRGEESYKAEKYTTAVEQLEIAAFGLGADRTLRGKALVLLSLSHHYLQNTEDSDKNLKSALELLDESEIAALELNAPSLSTLQECLSRIRPPVPEKPALRDESGEQPPDDAEADLEEEIRLIKVRMKSDLDNPAHYFDLFEAHRRQGDDKTARKTLQNLLKRKPEEIQAYYQLGALDYQSRRYKEAARYFNELFRHQGSIPFPEETLELARIYHILSVHFAGNRKKALKMLTGSLSLLTEERIHELPLSHRDRSQILQIIKNNRTLLDANKSKADKQKP